MPSYVYLYFIFLKSQTTNHKSQITKHKSQEVGLIILMEGHKDTKRIAIEMQCSSDEATELIGLFAKGTAFVRIGSNPMPSPGWNWCNGLRPSVVPLDTNISGLCRFLDKSTFSRNQKRFLRVAWDMADHKWFAKRAKKKAADEAKRDAAKEKEKAKSAKKKEKAKAAKKKARKKKKQAKADLRAYKKWKKERKAKKANQKEEASDGGGSGSGGGDSDSDFENENENDSGTGTESAGDKPPEERNTSDSSADTSIAANVVKRNRGRRARKKQRLNDGTAKDLMVSESEGGDHSSDMGAEEKNAPQKRRRRGKRKAGDEAGDKDKNKNKKKKDGGKGSGGGRGGDRCDKGRDKKKSGKKGRRGRR